MCMLACACLHVWGGWEGAGGWVGGGGQRWVCVSVFGEAPRHVRAGSPCLWFSFGRRSLAHQAHVRPCHAPPAPSAPRAPLPRRRPPPRGPSSSPSTPRLPRAHEPPTSAPCGHAPPPPGPSARAAQPKAVFRRYDRARAAVAVVTSGRALQCLTAVETQRLRLTQAERTARHVPWRLRRAAQR